MKISITNRQKDLKITPSLVKAIVNEVVNKEKFQVDEVALHFISDKAMRKLHADYFDDPSPTDCISFPLYDQSGAYRILGDVFICPQAAILYADKRGKNSYEELTLYIVHGLLHLMGYDDIISEDRVKMRRAESKQLKNLRLKGLILGE